MDIQNVVVTASNHGVCLRWEYNGFRYHTWDHTPGVIFKNPLVETPVYGRTTTRKLDAKVKANAAMFAKAQQIAQEQDLYTKATESTRQAEAAERAAHQAALIRANKIKAVDLMYDTLDYVLAELCNMTTTQFSLGKDKIIRERVRETLAVADGKE